MTIDLGSLPMLRRDIGEQQRRFGRKRVTLQWWPEAGQYVFWRGAYWSPGDPFKWTSEYAKEIRGSDLLFPPHDAWGHDRRVPGAVIFDPHDYQPKALGVFRELARRVGEFLELLCPDLCESELKPLLSSTHPAVRARDWTLAWIFRRQFNDCDDEPNFGGELLDAFGLLIECIDNELETLRHESPSPKPHAWNRIGKRTVWADFTTSGSATPPRPTKRTPVKRLGRPPATDDQIKEACEVWIEYQRSGKGPKEFCEWRNGDKKVGRVGVKWLNAKLALVRKYRSESPDRIPKQFANKIKPLRRVKKAV